MNKIIVYLIKDDLKPLPFDDFDLDNFWPEMVRVSNKAFGLSNWKFKRLSHNDLLPYTKSLTSNDCITIQLPK